MQIFAKFSLFETSLWLFSPPAPVDQSLVTVEMKWVCCVCGCWVTVGLSEHWDDVIKPDPHLTSPNQTARRPFSMNILTH